MMKYECVNMLDLSRPVEIVRLDSDGTQTKFVFGTRGNAAELELELNRLAAEIDRLTAAHGATTYEAHPLPGAATEGLCVIESSDADTPLLGPVLLDGVDRLVAALNRPAQNPRLVAECPSPECGWSKRYRGRLSWSQVMSDHSDESSMACPFWFPDFIIREATEEEQT